MARHATTTKVHEHANAISSPSRDDFAAMLEASFETQSPQEGAVITGTVVAIENDFAVVDVGLKTEGRVSLKEFSMPGVPPSIAVGDQSGSIWGAWKTRWVRLSCRATRRVAKEGGSSSSARSTSRPASPA